MEVVENYWNLLAYRAFSVTILVGSAEKPARDVVVVKNFKIISFTYFVTANVAPNGIIIFFAGVH